MSADQTPFILHENYKAFKAGVDRIERSDLIPYNSQKSCLHILLEFAFSMPLFVAILYNIILIAIVPLLIQVFGQDTTATVTHCRMEDTKSGHVMIVAYRFTWKHEIFASSEPISLFDADKFDFEGYCYSNTPLPIRVLDANRRWNSILISGTPAAPKTVDAIFQGIVCLMFAIWGYSSLRSIIWKIQALIIYPRFMRHSTLLEGEILSIRGHKPPKSPEYVVNVIYGFEAPYKKYLTGYAEVRRDDLKDAQLPPVGSRVMVLYADDHAHMML